MRRSIFIGISFFSAIMFDSIMDDTISIPGC